MTINELVKAVRPDYVSVDNPKVKGVPTSGTAEVASVKIDFDKVDGLMMYVTIA